MTAAQSDAKNMPLSGDTRNPSSINTHTHTPVRLNQEIEIKHLEASDLSHASVK
jgi:hypothetical protein